MAGKHRRPSWITAPRPALMAMTGLAPWSSQLDPPRAQAAVPVAPTTAKVGSQLVVTPLVTSTTDPVWRGYWSRVRRCDD
jgi:hypothetical protein